MQEGKSVGQQGPLGMSRSGMEGSVRGAEFIGHLGIPFPQSQVLVERMDVGSEH